MAGAAPKASQWGMSHMACDQGNSLRGGDESRKGEVTCTFVLPGGAYWD